MYRQFYLILFVISAYSGSAQQVMTPELLWSLGRVAGQGMSADKKMVYYSVSIPNIKENKSSTYYYEIPIAGGTPRSVEKLPTSSEIKLPQGAMLQKTSPDGKYVVYTKEVLISPMMGKDLYPDLTKSDVYVYNDLNQRHWDTWEDGYYSHLFVAELVGNVAVKEKDIMTGEPYDCPNKPHGGADDFTFSPDSKHIVYSCKKKSGKEYALSTNTNLYAYELASGKTMELTSFNAGFDSHPSFSPDGNSLAWLAMKRDGYESDKQDLLVMDWQSRSVINLTEERDETINNFWWDENGKRIFFTAPYQGTEQLYEISSVLKNNDARQISQGQHNITGIVGQSGSLLVVGKTDMNHANELYTLDINTGQLQPLTHVNDDVYSSLSLSRVQGRYTKLDHKDKLFSWVIYPPDFDSTKKYPLLLYCQGGPQSALSQYYSFRWNFQLMAAQGYIVIAPNRTGMPGWGTAWNEAISLDWGGNPMRDYLAAVDDMLNEPYIDGSRVGAVGASYGGYSVFMLAGIHEGRFKTFISHCGLFDLKSWYGTTEELWFAHWDIGGSYWDKSNKEAQHSYKQFSPSNYVQQWNTPIMIIQGGKDFRVPIEQGLQAFQAAQLKGIKSRLLYFPEENHWVLKAQNGLIWQTEFFKWLKETL